MAVKFFSKQSLETKPPQFHSLSLELFTVALDCNQFCVWWIQWRTTKMIGSCNCPITDVRFQSTVRLQLCRLIRPKYSSLCTNHILGNCNWYDDYYYQQQYYQDLSFFQSENFEGKTFLYPNCFNLLNVVRKKRNRI